MLREETSMRLCSVKKNNNKEQCLGRLYWEEPLFSPEDAVKAQISWHILKSNKTPCLFSKEEIVIIAANRLNAYFC